MFDLPPKCPAIADKLTGIFGWRHTYKVSQKHKDITHHDYIQKSYSLTLPKKSSSFICKEPDSWVSVHHLQTQSGILDPDDCVKDVVDDREHINAYFEDSGPDPGVPQGGGDGASGTSSVGTGSPDIFRDPSQTNALNPHIEVTSTTTCPLNGLGLQVRRSSDPNLIQSLKNQTEPNKRWSAAAPTCSEECNLLDKVAYLTPQWEEDDDNGHAAQQPTTFSRSGRLSMQFLGDGNGYKWMEAAEKYQSQAYNSKSLPRETSKRKEPLGQAYESIREKDGEMLLIINEYGGPLGLTAIPDKEYGGLHVENVEQGSRAERGRLRKGDRILEINGTKLSGMSDTEIQDSLKRSLDCSELRVRVIRGDKLTNKFHSPQADQLSSKIATVSPTKKSQGAPVGTLLQMANTRKLGRRIEIALIKGQKGLGFSVTSRDNPAGGDCPKYIKSILPIGAAIEDGRLKPGDRLLEVDGESITNKTQAEVVETLKSKKLGSVVVLVVSRQQELVEEEQEKEIKELIEKDVQIPQSNVRSIIESKFEQQFVDKTPSDHQIKHSRSQSNVKNIIEQLNENKSEPQHFIDAGSESTTSNESQSKNMWKNREILSFNVPVHDSEKAGLGISVKGKKRDSGIYINNVINGGAASRDGRLKPSDLILSVNETSLMNQTNEEAMITLRTAMLKTASHPKYITMTVARNLSRANSSVDVSTENSQESSNTSENSGATVIYLTPEKKERNDLSRWNNPVLERLTGGVCSTSNPSKPLSSQQNSCWRNESYYMATDENWSPARGSKPVGCMRNNNSVLIEDDSEPMSPTIPFRPNDSVSTIASQSVHDATYSSQLSLDTNTSAEHFSRDAIGRRSISEKHHAALDARETGTYQRNKKLREERDRERRLQLTKSAYISGSIESITTRIANANAQFDKNHPDLQSEARDVVGELGPSLGLKKSSSLESLQTMVQEIQMDESRGPKPMLAPRGRIREESLRAAVVSEPGGKPRKTWLLEETDNEGGFSNRNGPFQSSLNDGKSKQRVKKPSILRGIGNMFRIGKHRKDSITPVEVIVADYATVGPKQMAKSSMSHASTKLGPPCYQPPPQPPKHNGIHNGDIYRSQQQYVNYDELQSQLSRRQPVYHSQRSTRNQDGNYMNNQYSTYSNMSTAPNGRPNSTYFEYETVQHNVAGTASLARKLSSIPDSPTKTQLHPPQQHPPQSWKPLNGFHHGNLGSSGRSRGPYVTQVHIPHSPPSSSSNGGLYNHHKSQSHASKV